MKKNKKRIYFLILSFVGVLCFSFIPGFSIRTEDKSRFFGFPAEWLGLYGHGGFSFKGVGFLLNITLFYLIFLFIDKTFKRVLVSNKNKG